MTNFTLYNQYTRKEVHDYFVPNGNYTPNAGIWGLHGTVYINGTDHDHVFFVTYGSSQGDHIFQEGISEEGIITWQSQPRQHLRERRVLRWIRQAHFNDKIYLFARSQKRAPYTYFGEINYSTHDPYKEYPVWFEYKLKDWSPPDQIRKEFVRSPTVFAHSKKGRVSDPRKKRAIKEELQLTSFDLHVRSLLTSNPHLIDAGDGYRWELDYEFDNGDVADIIFFGPGREVKVISIVTSELDVSYLKAIQSRLWRLQMCYERSEEESSEFIQSYLVAKKLSDVAKDFCEKYDVKTLLV